MKGKTIITLPVRRSYLKKHTVTPPPFAEDKDDHGNELFPPGSEKSVRDLGKDYKEYVDHTQGQKLKLKTITDPTPEGVDLKYNRLADEQKIRYSQSHVEGSQYTVYVWYEETK